MNDIGKRLIELRRKQGLSREALGAKIGVSKTSIKNWEDGENSPKVDHVKALAEFFNVSFDWLATGGEAAKQLQQHPSIAKFMAEARNFEEWTTNTIPVVEWDDDTPLDDDEVSIPFYKDISFACGHGAINGDAVEEYRQLRMGSRTLKNMGVIAAQAFAATARDDSMMPYIQDGDTIYIDKLRNQIKDGRIFAIRVGELHLCKRLYRTPDGGVRLVSDNAEEFPEIFVSRAQIMQGEFEVIGWVWSVSRLERW